MPRPIILLVGSIAGGMAPAFMVPANAASPSAAARISAQVIAARLLAPQNEERAALRIAPLVWDEILASHARKWAKALAARGVMEHSRSADRPGKGENLWSGTAGAYSPEEMIEGFLEERAMFKRARFPKVSKTGKWQDVAHYTQIIWQGTSAVGCAIESNAEDDHLVCRYAAPGNVMGEAVYTGAPPVPHAANSTPSKPPQRVLRKRRRGD